MTDELTLSSSISFFVQGIDRYNYFCYNLGLVLHTLFLKNRHAGVALESLNYIFPYPISKLLCITDTIW